MNSRLRQLVGNRRVVAGIFLAALLVIAAALWWNDTDTAIEVGPQEQEAGVNETEFPLSVPDGFELEVFARVAGARVLARDGLGNFWVSQPSEGTVSTIEMREGQEPAVHGVFRGLNNPHGLAINPANGGTMLYIAEEHRVVRVPLYSDGGLEEIAQLPSGGGHFTRTLEFGPDGRLYVSIGSSCNVCEENDERRATIYSMNSDGSDFRAHARGLRNAVFFDWSYVDGSMWATEMGRDNLGDDVPPDEINRIEEGKHYGWPYCYGNSVHDTQFDSSLNAENFCAGEAAPSAVNLQAHSAPLGLAFVPEEGWPEEWWYDLIVAFHGSWNRSEPTGYKLVRVKLDADGTYRGVEDFITGWHSGTRVHGRPVDLLIYPGGELYITDDDAGLIYRLHRSGGV